MNNLATRIDGVIATNNQDRQETNTRLGFGRERAPNGVRDR